MRKILVGLAMAGVGVVIALGARDDLLDRADAPDASAPAVTDAPARPDTGAAATAGDAPAPGGSAAAAELPATPPDRRGAADAADGSGENAAVRPPAGGAETSASAAGSDADAATEAGPARTAPAGSAAGQGVQAEEILRRAAAAYAEVRTLRADFVQRIENPILGSEITSRGTLYQRRPDRFLMRFSDPAGDVIVSDGRYFWIYYPSVDERQVLRAPAGVAGARGVDLQAQFLGNPLERFTPTLEGRESVAGRAAYVLTLDPREPVGYRRLKVWVDARDSLVRRFELTEMDGRVRRFELRDLEANVTLDDALFRFTPPPDAIVVDRG